MDSASPVLAPLVDGEAQPATIDFVNTSGDIDLQLQVEDDGVASFFYFEFQAWFPQHPAHGLGGPEMHENEDRPVLRRYRQRSKVVQALLSTPVHEEWKRGHG